MQSFYIFEGNEKLGPFDLVSMIKKIRNGKLQADSMVISDEMESAVQANQIKVLHEFFIELEYADEPDDSANHSLADSTLCADWRMLALF